MLYIYWFRKDLRLVDNKGLSEFIKQVSDKNKFAFLYIKNKSSYKYFGEKRIAFLLECITELKKDLRSLKLNLNIIEGNSSDVFRRIIDKNKSVTVFCNSQVEPYCIERDRKVKKILTENDCGFSEFTDTTIFEMNEIKNGEGKQYKVYTPFRDQCLNTLTPAHYQKCDVDLELLNKANEIVFNDLKEYRLDDEYKKSDKSGFIIGGRKEGLNRLKNFYESGLEKYRSQRDFPYDNGTSLLSAHIHFGTVGIREALRTAIVKLKKAKSNAVKTEVQTWINELLWREFYYNITFHNPWITKNSYSKEFDNLKWDYDEKLFQKWCEGKTGFPIVDAGMRQLSKEGWMHNRLRMITAMFLTKDLFIDWRYGEKYFADNLIDLDFSNNNGGWQWSASTGVDAQPYFRIFNPYLQSKKFDPGGKFIKKYISELKNVPEEFIHEPNLMSENQQKMYGVKIGKDYPLPIVDHSKARENVIEKFTSIRN